MAAKGLAWLAIAAAACGPTAARDAGPDDDRADARPGERDGGSIPPAGGPYEDFPADPILDGAAPADSPQGFGDPGSGSASGGPCLVEPELGALIPINWLRLRIAFEPAGAQDLFEIRVHVDNQINDLVVYTTNTRWTMPKEMWTKLLAHSYDLPITIGVRGAVTAPGGGLEGEPALGSSGTVTIAPAAAGGAIVYWTTSGGTALKGFRIGDESVQEVLRPVQAQTSCVGCHTSTPDGEYAGFTGAGADPDDDTMFVGLRAVDGSAGEPSWLSAAGRTLLSRGWQEAPSFSPAHFTMGDRIALSMYDVTNIIWTDLEAASTTQGVGWGILARAGDPNAYPASADFSNDGTRIVYCSSPNYVISGVETSGCDLYTIPYADRMGGAASPVAGASDPSWGEYYPAFSPDDRLIAFTRIPPAENTYDNPLAELFVLPAEGGTPERLRANDPPECAGRTSPGITNSWPKWSPTVTSKGSKTYYWLTFSSTREHDLVPQLYVTAIVTDELGIPHTFPSLYLWNQPEDEGNHAPAWDSFEIPIP